MLKTVSLSRNANLAVDVRFQGQVPRFQLRALMLSGCDLDNSIITGPNLLATQRRLEILDLSNNNLSGSIVPSWIFTDGSALAYLNIARNWLAGPLGSMWQHASVLLRVINMSTNCFDGHPPGNISSVFPSLVVLDASHNLISGSIPPSLCDIAGMELVDLSSNKLSGEVPSCLFTKNSAPRVLKLSSNGLGGAVFGGASNLSVARAVYLDGNRFEGTLPGNLSAGGLDVIDLHDNRLSGRLDASFWHFPSLQVLNIASNRLTGEIDPAICRLTSMQLLDMSDNSFSGSTPSCIGTLPLTFLNLSWNSLSGHPSYFLSNSYIAALDLRYNQYVGDLDWVPSLHWIKLLWLGGNRFEGWISERLCRLQHLNIIDLSHNRLQGSLPPCIGDISFGRGPYDAQALFSVYDDSTSTVDVELLGLGLGDIDDPSFMFTTTSQYSIVQSFTFSTKGSVRVYSSGFLDLMFGIDLSANMLSGEIPFRLGNLSSVKSLNLSNNFFTGQIPATFAGMRAIESLDLSHNGLSGQIPCELTKLWSLEVFSVAYNNLSGCVPWSGQFSTFSTDSYVGNVNLHSTCVSDSSPIKEEAAGASYQEEDPVLYTMSVTAFLLAFFATVSIMLFHSFLSFGRGTDPINFFDVISSLQR